MKFSDDQATAINRALDNAIEGGCSEATERANKVREELGLTLPGVVATPGMIVYDPVADNGPCLVVPISMCDDYKEGLLPNVYVGDKKPSGERAQVYACHLMECGKTRFTYAGKPVVGFKDSGAKNTR